MDEKILKFKEGISTSLFDNGSGEEVYLINYHNRNWKVSKLIYYVYRGIDGKRSIVEIKDFLLEKYSLNIDTNNINKIIQVAFIKNGLIEGTESITEAKKNKMLWGKITLLKSDVVSRFKWMSFLFNKRYIKYLGIMEIVWILFVVTTNSNTEVLNDLFEMNISDVILCYLYIFITGIVHEFGHTVASMNYGAKPGRIGIAVYFIMPVLFSDVTDSWKLKRIERTVVDIGGIYFQSVILTITFILNMIIFRSSLLNMGIVLSSFEIIANLNPFIKLDGYWVLVDYLGVSEIRGTVTELWKNRLKKILKKDYRKVNLSRDKKIVLDFYLILTSCFYIYFLRFLYNSVTLAITNLKDDILSFYSIGLLNLDYSFESIMQYVSSRITTYIALFFIIRILSMIIRKSISVILKYIDKLSFNKGEKNEINRNL